RLGSDTRLRAVVERALRGMRRVDACDLEWLTEEGSCVPGPWHAISAALAVLILATLIAAPFYPVVLLGLVAGATGSLLVRASATTSIRAASRAFSQLAPLLAAASTLRQVGSEDDAPLTGALSSDLPALGTLH